MEQPGPEVVQVVEWKYHDVHVGDGRGLPPQSVPGGPKGMLIRCTKCNKGPWRVTEGLSGADQSHFHAVGTMVSVYCGSCEQLRGQAVSGLPGFAEAHTR